MLEKKKSSGNTRSCLKFAKQLVERLTYTYRTPSKVIFRFSRRFAVANQIVKLAEDVGQVKETAAIGKRRVYTFCGRMRLQRSECSKCFTTYKRKNTVALTVRLPLINNERTTDHRSHSSLISREDKPPFLSSSSSSRQLVSKLTLITRQQRERYLERDGQAVMLRR